MQSSVSAGSRDPTRWLGIQELVDKVQVQSMDQYKLLDGISYLDFIVPSQPYLNIRLGQVLLTWPPPPRPDSVFSDTHSENPGRRGVSRGLGLSKCMSISHLPAVKMGSTRARASTGFSSFFPSRVSMRVIRLAGSIFCWFFLVMMSMLGTPIVSVVGIVGRTDGLARIST